MNQLFAMGIHAHSIRFALSSPNQGPIAARTRRHPASIDHETSRILITIGRPSNDVVSQFEDSITEKARRSSGIESDHGSEHRFQARGEKAIPNITRFTVRSRNLSMARRICKSPEKNAKTRELTAPP